MAKFTDDWEDNAARRAAELHRYDQELLGANWNPSIGMLALSCGHTDRELRPRLPEDSVELEPGFLIQVRALANRI